MIVVMVKEQRVMEKLTIPWVLIHKFITDLMNSMEEYLLLTSKVMHLNSNNRAYSYDQFWWAFQEPYIQDFHKKNEIILFYLKLP